MENKGLIRKIVAFALAATMIVGTGISVYADEVVNEENAKYYVLKDADQMPSDLHESDSSTKYVGVGNGSIDTADITATEGSKPSVADGDIVNEETVEVEDFILSAPTPDEIAAKLYGGDTEIALYIDWYRIIKEGDGWHVDGTAVPVIDLTEVAEVKADSRYYKAAAYGIADFNISVTYGDTVLTEGTDYEIVGVTEDLTNPGSKSATVKFKGKYSGSKEVTFAILGEKVRFYLQGADGKSYTSLGDGAFSAAVYELLAAADSKVISQDNAEIAGYMDGAVLSDAFKAALGDGVQYIKLCKEADGYHVDVRYSDSANYAVNATFYLRKMNVARPEGTVGDVDSNYVTVAEGE